MNIAYEIMHSINEPFICIVDGIAQEYENGKIAYSSIISRDSVQGKLLEYTLDSISVQDGKIVVGLKKGLRDPDTVYMDADWMKEHIARVGVAPDLFDGD